MEYELLIWATGFVAFGTALVAYLTSRDVFHPALFLCPLLAYSYWAVPLLLVREGSLWWLLPRAHMPWVHTYYLLGVFMVGAGTLCAGAKVVKDAGAERILAAATHGLLSGRAVDRLRESVIEEVLLTDTVPLPEDAAGHDLFKVLSVDRILADSVHNVFCDESVSAIFAGENQLF